MVNLQHGSRFSRVVSFVIDESPLWVWIVGFFLIVLVFGLIFAWLTPLGYGMENPSSPDRSFDFWQGLYFSVVTVSSLGYGDLHPTGISKVLAGVEVVMGLGLIGIVIAKLTLKRVSHFVSRLFASETKRQLQNFVAMFDLVRMELRGLLDELSREYQPTPAQTEPEQKSNPDIEHSLRKVLDRLLVSTTEFHEYIRVEGSDRSYFTLEPVSSFTQLAEAVEEALFLLGQSIVMFPIKSNPSILNEVLTYTNRRTLDSIVTLQTETSDLIISGRKIDATVRKSFERIPSLCSRIDQSLLVVDEQPDQAFG